MVLPAGAAFSPGGEGYAALVRLLCAPAWPVDRATFEAAMAAEVRAAVGGRLARSLARQSARRRQV